MAPEIRTRVWLACACVAAQLLAARSGVGADWPQWLGPDRDGHTTETIASWPPRHVWRARVGVGYSSPVVADGRVYALGHEKPAAGPEGRGKDSVFCLDAATGSELWRHQYDCQTARRDSTASYPGPRATPAFADGSVFALSLEGLLTCLDARTGTVRWSHDLPRDLGGEIPFYGYCGSPLVYGRTVIVEANAPKDGTYAAFDVATGRLAWRSGGDGASTASPALAHVDGLDLVLFVSGRILAAVDATNGSPRWRVDLGWDTWMGPCVAGELVFASSASLARGCAVYRIGRDAPLWTARRTYQALHCNSVIAGGHVYGSDNTRTDYQYEDHNRSSLKCVELTTGQVAWAVKGLGWANTIVAGDTLVILREAGELVLVDASAAACRERGRAQVVDGPCWTVPALAGGRIYCRSNAGDIVCVDVSPDARASVR
jgi:outer membrane protein assembly factor BamB